MVDITKLTVIGKLGDEFTVVNGVINVSNAVAGGTAGLISGVDKTKLDNVVSFSINDLIAESSIDDADYIAIWDISVSALRKMTKANFVAGLSPGTTNSYIISRSIEGAVYETSLMYWIAPATCTISSVLMALSSNPSATGSYCKVQIMKNGVLETNSIFTSDVPAQITELTSATNGIYQASGTLDSGQTSLAAGDILHFRVNQADTGCADLLIQVKVNFT